MPLVLEILTPEKKIWSGEVESIRAPGSRGSFGVLPRHQALVAALATGALEAQTPEKRLIFAVHGGVAEVGPDKVRVLCPAAELPQDLDKDRAQASLDRAKDRLSAKDRTVDRARARAAIDRAINRLRILRS